MMLPRRHIHNGKQNHQCKDCGRQFVDGFEQHLVSDETRDLVERITWISLPKPFLNSALQLLCGSWFNCWYKAYPVINY
jgi:hypothetical protein